MAKSLWDFYDGEPFMENPQPLIVLNPKKKGSKTMAKKSAKARMAYARSFRKGAKRAAKRKRVTRRASGKHTHWGRIKGHRRRVNPRRRRNAFPMAGAVVNRRRHSYRRNPAILGVTLPTLNTILYAGAGFVGTPMVEGFINKFVPIEWRASSIGKYAIKIASAVGLAFAVKQVLGAEVARTVAIGGATYVLVSAVNEFLPQLTMGSYNRTNGLRAYRSSKQLGSGGPASAFSGTAAQGATMRFGNRFGR